MGKEEIAGQAIVRATIAKHLAEAELTLARLESQARTVPATTRSSNAMLHLHKRIKEAQAIAVAWETIAKETWS